MKTTTVLTIIVCVMAVANFASADTIRGISMDFVTIGNAGNAGDTRTGSDKYGHPLAHPYGCGAVSSNYRIGKYEVTATQWQTINTAAGIGDSGTWSGEQPVADISWYGAAQFCNYLTSGNKYLGAYKFDMSGNFLSIDRVSSISTYGTTYVIPAENEWYKAAYFKPNASGYSLYANGTNICPPASEALWGLNKITDSPWNIGSGTMEQNGTFDMMGNIREWNETPIDGSYRGIRGGCYADHWTNLGVENLTSSYRYGMTQDYENRLLGFRIAEIPEPATLLLLGLGAFMATKRRK